MQEGVRHHDAQGARGEAVPVAVPHKSVDSTKCQVPPAALPRAKVLNLLSVAREVEAEENVVVLQRVRQNFAHLRGERVVADVEVVELRRRRCERLS